MIAVALLYFSPLRKFGEKRQSFSFIIIVLLHVLLRSSLKVQAQQQRKWNINLKGVSAVHSLYISLSSKNDLVRRLQSFFYEDGFILFR